MRMNRQRWVIILLLGFLVGFPIMSSKKVVQENEIENEISINVDSLRVEYNKSVPVKEGLMLALEHFEIQHPEIVYAQAIIETGNFKSKNCTIHNNLFGLYNSKARRYHRFEHWIDAVIAYKKWIQRRYRKGENYYSFLERIGYAEDPDYTRKVRKALRRVPTYNS